MCTGNIKAAKNLEKSAIIIIHGASLCKQDSIATKIQETFYQMVMTRMLHTFLLLHERLAICVLVSWQSREGLRWAGVQYSSQTRIKFFMLSILRHIPYLLWTG